MKLFEKDYIGEELNRLERDLCEAFDKDNEVFAAENRDKFKVATFRVTIEVIEDDHS